MKNIILTGVPRAGKTTFSKMILNTFDNYEIINGDKVIENYFKKICDETNDKIVVLDINNGYRKIKDVFSDKILSNPKKNFILDYMEINEIDILKYIKNDCLVFIFGYPKSNIDSLIKNTQKYDNKDDWTYYESINKLRNHFNYYLEKSIHYEKFCKENNIFFVDVSIDRNKVLNKAIEYLKKINI